MRRCQEAGSVWMVSREFGELAGAGGVKDVTRELSRALAASGCDVRVFLPCYGFIRPEEFGFQQESIELEIDLNYAHEERRELVRFWSGEIDQVGVTLVESQRFFEKQGVYTYSAVEEAADPAKRRGEGHFDYFAMNVLLQKAALAYGVATGRRPGIFHCHDGHSALLPVISKEVEGYRHFYRECGFLITIHNAGIGYHQEVADLPFAKAITSLPWRVIYSGLLNGSFDPLLSGPSCSMVNTVSENYARELQETELDSMTGWLGHALKDRGITLHGITNGITPDDWDPRYPDRLGLPMAFDPVKGELEGKKVALRELRRMIHASSLESVSVKGEIDKAKGPLFTVISRLTRQKGMDLLAECLESVMVSLPEAGMLILGSGEAEIEERLSALAEHPACAGKLAVMIGYAPSVANFVYAAGDFFVIPSRFEPCGLTDFIAQLMGNIPVVRATGGLVKVKDNFNGFVFQHMDPAELAGVMIRAAKVFTDSPERLQQIRENGIRNIYDNYTWERVKDKHLELYRRSVPGVCEPDT